MVTATTSHQAHSDMHIMNPALGCHYFRQARSYLPSRRASPTEAHRCEKLAQGFYAVCPAETRTHDLLIASATLYHSATTPPLSYLLSLSVMRFSEMCYIYSVTCLTVRVDVCSVRDLRLIVMPVSTRVHEASLTARLLGRLETEHAEMVYAHMGASRRCPSETNNSQQLNCSVSSSLTSQLSHVNCSNHTIRQNISSAPARTETLLSVAIATNDAISQLVAESAVWDKLTQKSRNFLRSTRPFYTAVTVNTSAYVISGDYSSVVDELLLLLPVPPHDVTLPRMVLCVDCETALYASVSGLLAIASAQRATGSQCLLGHVFYACAQLSAAERFYFRSNWSRAESELRDVQNWYSDSTSRQLYADTMQCPQLAFTTISASIEQSRGCTTDDVISWYSACRQMLRSTNDVMKSLIAKSHRTVAAAWQHCVLEIVVYACLICVQVCFVYYVRVILFLHSN